jgi:phosphopantothenoylcysteine decarboxylase/phosphopantothenate--cysteine ligase
MNQKLVLGVGGGIAAYKSCDLLRRFQDLGFDVTVIPTPAALNFVGSATWEALSGKKVSTQVWENVEKVNHVQIGDLADFIVIAPATADLIARIATGRADDLLTNTVLASTAKKMLVPAMHPKMWLNPATIENVKTLRSRGFVVMEPAVGRLTGSDSGIGRFPETGEIINNFFKELANELDLKGIKFLITLGGTRENIDDVRFIGNRSSGKQGRAIAEVALSRGADVTVIAANSAEVAGAKNVVVQNTAELEEALNQNFNECNVLIMSAAVSDAKPKLSVSGKIKKQNFTEIELETNPDLLKNIAKSKRNQLIVGFAAESENVFAEGMRKLSAKNLDILYANDIANGAIFGSDFTTGHLIWNESGTTQNVEVTDITKAELASQLLDIVKNKLG